MSARFELRECEKLGRYAVAARDLRAGETILSEAPFLLGPRADASLSCLACHRPLTGRMRACTGCGVAPVCSDPCPEYSPKCHSVTECEFFKSLKDSKGIGPMALVPHVGAVAALRALLKRRSDPAGWGEFVKLETHLDKRRNTSLWAYHENTVEFLESLGLLEHETDPDLVQKVCAIIDINSFDVRGPPAPGAQPLRGVYLRAALMAHDCVANTQLAVNDNNLLVCHATRDIKKGEPIYYNYTDPMKVCHATRDIKKGEPIDHNYTDPMKGTVLRQEHLLLGKYFKCSCARCSDATELGTHLSSAICPECKTGYVSQAGETWTCNACAKEIEADVMRKKVQSCSDKLDVINQRDEKSLEEYIKYVALVLAPNHYLLLDAKQKLAGVLRDVISQPHATKRVLRRQLSLCREILNVLETLRPGISRMKAITLYEVHATMVQLAKKQFDSRELTGSSYLDELLSAEKYLKRALEMLFIEPGNSPEGELCAKALKEYRTLKETITSVLDSIHTEGKAFRECPNMSYRGTVDTIKI